MKPHRHTLLTALLTAGLLAAPATAPAQTLGVEVGGSFASVTGDDAGDPDTRAGLLAGVHVGFPVTDIVSVVPGLWYVQKGAEYAAGSQTLPYVEIPLLVSVAATGPDRPVSVDLFAGPGLAFRVGCSQDIPGASDDCVNEDELSSFDVGLVAGAGLGFDRFFVRGGLDLGLTSLDDSELDRDLKNVVYFVTAGVHLPLGR